MSIEAPLEETSSVDGWITITCDLKNSSKRKNCKTCRENSKPMRPMHDCMLVLSANDGCRSCLVACLALRHFGMLRKYVHSRDYVQLELGSDPIPSITIIPKVGNWEKLEFYLKPDYESHLTGGRTRKNLFLSEDALYKRSLKDTQTMGWMWQNLSALWDIDKDASSAATFDRIRGWISSCEADHPKCQANSAPLPTRVINVSDFDGSKPCQLYESHGEVGTYITLSHCWGRDLGLIYKTTTATLEQNKICIPWDSLSKTFQDAISMTRRLGICYLWIDSLCIIQEDSDDWERESVKMGTIYKNSYLTLAAAASDSGVGGLFVDRDSEVFEVNLPQKMLVKPPPINCRRRRPHNALDPTKDCDPLTTRAWAYQERLLSQRIIHFSSEELVWECRTTQICECGGYKKDEKARYDRMLSGEEPNNVSRYYDPWHKLVHSYTNLCLTFEDDKFPALSGIASQLLSEAQYVAGLRRDKLPQDLFWHTDLPKRENTPIRRPVKYRAPSWSWASVEGCSVNWTGMGSYLDSQHHAATDLCIIESSCTTIGSPFGRVSSGYLIVKGLVLDAILPTNSWNGLTCTIHHPTEKSQDWGIFHPDYDTIEPKVLSELPISLLVSRHGVRPRPHSKYVVREDPTAFTLVLQQSPRDETAYERIGWGTHFGETPFAGYTGSWEPSEIKII